jgi:hypothetical protein
LVARGESPILPHDSRLAYRCTEELMMSDARATYAADGGPDDLPRAVLREREARYREDLARAGRQPPPPPPQQPVPELTLSALGEAPTRPIEAAPSRLVAGDGVVRALNIPFWRLMMFGFKLVFASIPAFVLLGVLLWLGMTMVQVFFPELTKMQVLIHFPK